MKPYRQVPIQECGEPLVAIPLELFAIETPHPYLKCGADYNGSSPYYLRQGVLDRVIQAQVQLQQLHPDWRLQIFDAYRPVEVQQYMVDLNKQNLPLKLSGVLDQNPNTLNLRFVNVYLQVIDFFLQ